MSVSRFGSHLPSSPSPSSLSMDQVRNLIEENRRLKEQVTSLQAQLDVCLSPTPVPVVLPLQARRTVDFGSSRSSTSGLSPSRSVMPVAKSGCVSSTKRHSQSSSSVVLSLDLLELSTPVPGPDNKGGRETLLTLMREIFQAGKDGKSGKDGMGPLQKASLKLEQCMALPGAPFVLTDLMKARECASTASTVSGGGVHCWAEEGRLKTQCGGCLFLVSTLKKAWGRQTSGGFFRRRTSSTSSTNN